MSAEGDGMTPKRALLHVLNDIEDVGGIHNRFMPDLVNDIVQRLGEHNPPFKVVMQDRRVLSHDINCGLPTSGNDDPDGCTCGAQS